MESLAPLEKDFLMSGYTNFPERKFCGDARNFGLSVARGRNRSFYRCGLQGRSRTGRIKFSKPITPLIWPSEERLRMEILKAPLAGPLTFVNSVNGCQVFVLENLGDIAGANMSYKRKAFQEYGLFIEGTYSSDTEFHWRLRRNKSCLQFAPSILVFHHNIDQFKRFLRHEFEHGRSFARVRIKTQHFSELRRFVYTVFSFLIPVWLILKIGLRNLRNRIYLFHFLKGIAPVNIRTDCLVSG